MILEPALALSLSRLKINQMIRNFPEQYYFRQAITNVTTKTSCECRFQKKTGSELIYNRGMHEN